MVQLSNTKNNNNKKRKGEIVQEQSWISCSVVCKCRSSSLAPWWWLSANLLPVNLAKWFSKCRYLAFCLVFDFIHWRQGWHGAPILSRSKVMCFHPWSDVTLPLMKKHEIVKVIDKWAELVHELGAVYPWVQVRYARTRAHTHTRTHPHPHTRANTHTCSNHSVSKPSLQFFILMFFYWPE